MRSYFLVFFKPGACDWDRATQYLTKQGLTVKANTDGLVVGRKGSPQFKIVLNQEPEVAVEAREIARGTAHSEPMSQCSCRFEVSIEDLDEALDEINTLMEVEVALQEATGGFVFLPWNGLLSASLWGKGAA